MIKLKFNYKNFLSHNNNLLKFARTAISLQETNSLLKQAVKLIKLHTTRGISVNKFKGPEGKFKDLKASTIKARERLKKQGLLVKGVGAKKSRLTLTGQMIDSISYKVTGMGSGKLYFKKRRVGGGINNEELAQIHEDGTNKIPKRPFFNLSYREYKILKGKLERDIKNKLKKLF